MRIAILLNAPYPYGMACTNRIHLYAKGLKACKNDISVFIPKPTESPGKVRNTKTVGDFEGINFKYTYKSTVRSNRFIGRRVHDFISFFLAFYLLCKNSPDIILLVGSRFQYILLGKICSKFTKAKFIREKSEVPFWQNEKLSKMKKIRIRAEFRLFDGMLVISGALKDFFHNFVSSKTKLLEVPILIDSDKVILNQNIPTQIKPNLVYTGSLLNKKDGVITIIEAFSKVLQENRSLRLKLTGDINESPDKNQILSLIDDLNLKKEVELLGYISKEKLQELTLTATALLLAKPDNRQNRYNMATKIGEYLLTGRPVIVSDVDPVSSYLRHKEDAFIVRPDADDFAKTLSFIINNPGEANSIGLNGRKSALRFFDYKVHALRMDEFLKTL